VSGAGPQLDSLTRRVAECPADFRQAPRVGSGGGVHVDAVVRDVIVELGGAPPAEEALARFAPDAPVEGSAARELGLVLVGAWLLADDWFREAGGLAARALAWLETGLATLAGLVGPEPVVADPDRREEFVRLCLRALDVLPRGESAAVAEDRLKTLDSVARDRLIRQTRGKQERARELRRKMEEERAREAAARGSREW